MQHGAEVATVKVPPSALCDGKRIRQVLPLTYATLVIGTLPAGPLIRKSATVKLVGWMAMSKVISTKPTEGFTRPLGIMFVIAGPALLAMKPWSNATELLLGGMSEWSARN